MITREQINPKYLFCLDMQGATDKWLKNINAEIKKYQKDHLALINSQDTFEWFIIYSFIWPDDETSYWNFVCEQKVSCFPGKKIKVMKYYLQTFHYSWEFAKKNKRQTTMSQHVVYAENSKKATQIIEKYLIFESSNALKTGIKKLDMRFRHNKDLIKRRKQNIGGKIWT